MCDDKSCPGLASARNLYSRFESYSISDAARLKSGPGSRDPMRPQVSKGKIESEIILIFLEPFIKITATSKDSRIHRAVGLLFNHLIRQTDVGIEYEEKLRAWKEMEMPCERPEELEVSFDNCQEEEENEEGKDTESDEMAEETVLDPRAGKVDAILPQIPVDCDGILTLIKKYQNSESVTKAGLRELRSFEGKFVRLKRGKMPENIRKPKILQEFKKKRRHTSKCVRELMEYTRKLDEDIDLDLNYDAEIDSGEESNVSPGGRDNSRSEDSPGPATKKVKSKSENKSSKKKMKSKTLKSPVSAGKENKEAKREMKTKKDTDGERGKNKVKAKEKKKGVKILKPKSPKESFKVEDVKKGCESLMIAPNTKRKSSNSWIVDDLDNKEDKKIVTPKIIKIETKTGTILPVEIKESVKSEECDTPQLKLSAAFWDKAKEKIFKKKKTSLPVNPAALFDQPKNSRRISFALERNEAQENEEYINEVRNSPSIPFDGSRKPVQSALKSGLHPSPINPFYKFKMFH